MSSAFITGILLLLACVLVSAGCSDLKILRTPAGVAADTLPETDAAPRSRSRSRRTDSALDSGEVASSFGEIRRTLRGLVAAEETFFAENGTYSDDFSHIGFKPESNTSIRFLWISRDGWAASGTHPALPGRDCVIFVGQTDAPPTTLKFVRRGREGTPVCDEPRAPPPSRPQGTVAPPTAGTPAPRPASADTGNALDALDPRILMKVDLRNLAHSQEIYLGMQGIYARRTESMALQYLWHKGVRVKILAADAQSWIAKATHARLQGKSCVIWVGNVVERPLTDGERRQESRAGVPVCDG